MTLEMNVYLGSSKPVSFLWKTNQDFKLTYQWLQPLTLTMLGVFLECHWVQIGRIRVQFISTFWWWLVKPVEWQVSKVTTIKCNIYKNFGFCLELCKQGCIQWFTAYSAPRHYQNPCSIITNSNIAAYSFVFYSICNRGSLRITQS